MAQGHEDEARGRQVRVLRELVARLEGGDASLPTDVFSPMERELEQRRDQAAVAEAWEEESEGVTQPSAIGVPLSPRAARMPREVVLLGRAARELASLGDEERAAITRLLGALSCDPLPRGAAPLEGRWPNHLSMRDGRLRVLYRVSGGEILVAAIEENCG